MQLSLSNRQLFLVALLLLFFFFSFLYFFTSTGLVKLFVPKWFIPSPLSTVSTKAYTLRRINLKIRESVLFHSFCFILFPFILEKNKMFFVCLFVLIPGERRNFGGLVYFPKDSDTSLLTYHLVRVSWAIRMDWNTWPDQSLKRRARVWIV